MLQLRRFADVEYPIAEAASDGVNTQADSQTRIGEALPLIFVEPSSCLAQFLQPYLWFIHVLEICVGAAAILMNGAAGVATFYADGSQSSRGGGQVFPLRVRRAFALMAFNYALVAAVIVGKRCVALVAVYYPCVTVVSALNCRLQEFPLLLAFTHAIALPLALALAQRRALSTSKTEPKTVDWTRCFSLMHVLLLIGCASAAFYFTAFDEVDFRSVGGRVNLFQKCSILVAIDRQRAFWLLTSLMALQVCGAVLWAVVGTVTLSVTELWQSGGSAKLPLKSAIKPKWSPNDYETCYRTTGGDEFTVPLMAKTNVDENANEKLVGEERTRMKENSMKSLCNKELPLSSKVPLNIVGSGPRNPYAQRVCATAMRTPLKKSVWIVESAVESRQKRTKQVLTVVESGEVVAFRAAAQALHASFRDVVLLEAAGWLAALLGSGAALAAEHVVLPVDDGGKSRDACPRCTFLAIELFFSVTPLLIAVGHAMLSMWLILPIRQAAIQLFPAILGRALPAPEPTTPPLPDVFFPAERKMVDERKGEMHVIEWSTMTANRPYSLAQTPKRTPVQILVTSCESEPNTTVMEQTASQTQADERYCFAERRAASVE